MSKYNYIKWFDEISKENVGIVGGKGANLGELTKSKLPVPPGFCVTAQAYLKFIDYAGLDEVVRLLMESLDVEDTDKLTYVSKENVGIVGGKGANLGELTKSKLPVPPGFCVTAQAYLKFIDYAGLDEVVRLLMESLDVEDTDKLTYVSKEIQKKIKEGEFYPELKEEIISAYEEFSKKLNVKDPEVAVRSSATAEDLPDASFAGQQDTYLHISGEEELLKHIRDCFASLWTSRAIYYREKQNYNHFNVH